MTKKLRPEKVWVYISTSVHDKELLNESHHERIHVSEEGYLLKEKILYLFDRRELTNLLEKFYIIDPKSQDNFNKALRDTLD